MNRVGQQSATASLNLSGSLFDENFSLPLLPFQQFLHPVDVPQEQGISTLEQGADQLPSLPTTTAAASADVKPVVAGVAPPFGGSGVTELKLAGRQLIEFPQESFQAGVCVN